MFDRDRVEMKGFLSATIHPERVRRAVDTVPGRRPNEAPLAGILPELPLKIKPAGASTVPSLVARQSLVSPREHSFLHEAPPMHSRAFPEVYDKRVAMRCQITLTQV